MSKTAKREPPQEAPPARQNWPRPTADSALSQAGHIFARAGFSDATLILRWREIASEQIARIAQPAKWQEGPEGATLTLKCEPGTIVFLQHQTRELIQRLNSYAGIGRIARLKLTPARLSQAADVPSHPAPSAEFASAKAALPEALLRLDRTRTRLKHPRSRHPKG